MDQNIYFMVILIKTITSFFLLIWLVSSIYLGLGGYALMDIEQRLEYSKSMEPDSVYLKINNTQIKVRNSSKRDAMADHLKVDKIYAWIGLENLPKFFLYLITAISFSILGGLIQIFKKIAIDEIPLNKIKIFSLPIFCGLIGIVVMGISYIIPKLLVANSSEIRPTSLMFLCLFAGLYSKEFYYWIESQFQLFFKKH